MIAVVFGAALVLAALVFQPAPAPTPETSAAGEEVVTVALNREAIPVLDSNQDGVPDWQESFVANTPTVREIAEADTTYEPSDTLTDQFAREFFEEMVRSDTIGDFGASPAELIAQSSQALSEEAADELYLVDDLTVLEQSDSARLSRYGEAIARIFVNNGCEPTTPDITILETAVRNDQPELLNELDCRIEGYATYEAALLQLPVPASVRFEHLDLLNTMLALKNDLQAFQGVFDDPMYTLVRVRRYQSDAEAVFPALDALYETLVVNGASWSPESIVFAIINLN